MNDNTSLTREQQGKTTVKNHCVNIIPKCTMIDIIIEVSGDKCAHTGLQNSTEHPLVGPN